MDFLPFSRKKKIVSQLINSSSFIMLNKKFKSRKLDHLEKSWDNNVTIPQDHKRFAQMSYDIKKFLLQSNENNEEATRNLLEKSKLFPTTSSSVINTYEKIFSTMGFSHHEGTDYQLELNIVKTIMMREELINSLKFQISSISKQHQKNLLDPYFKDSSAMNANVILELLSQMREKTLNYLELLILWRQSASNKPPTASPQPASDSFTPKVFYWEEQNYTMKLVHDLDFLSENGTIVDSLHLLPQQLVANPLMLSNNLEDPNTWMDPYDRAMLDLTNGGQHESDPSNPQFENRLRLRLAERMLLQEIENNTVEPGDNVFVTQIQSSAPASAQVTNNNKKPSQHQHQHQRHQDANTAEEFLYKGSSVLENDDESMGLGNGGYRSNGPQAATLPPPDVYAMPQSRSSTISTGNKLNNTTNLNNNFDYFSGDWQYTETGLDQGGDDQEDEILFRYEDEMDWEQANAYAYNYNQANGYVNYNNNNNNNNNYNIKMNSNSDDAVMLSADEDELMQFPSSRDGMEANAANGVEEKRQPSKKDRTIDKISEIDMKILTSLPLPPKHVVLGGSIVMILLSPGKESPLDLSWKAFVKAIRHSNIVDQMNNFRPETIPKVKLIAVQGMLDQLSQPLPDMMDHQSLPLPQYSAVHKLLTWVMQFTSAAIKKVHKKSHNKIPSPSTSVGSVPRNLPDQTKAKKAGNENSASKQKLKETPKKKTNQIPKINFELAPFHSESLHLQNSPSNQNKNSQLLLILLTSSDRIVGENVAPLSLANDINDPPRLVMKVYDMITSTENTLNVNLREYILLQKDLTKKYPAEQFNQQEVANVFMPHNLQWWQQHGRKVIDVGYRNDGALKLTISKKRMEGLIVELLSTSPSEVVPAIVSIPPARISMVEQKKNEIKLATMLSQESKQQPPQQPQPQEEQPQDRRIEVSSCNDLNPTTAALNSEVQSDVVVVVETVAAEEEGDYEQSPSYNFLDDEVVVVSAGENGVEEPELPIHAALQKIMTMELQDFVGLLDMQAEQEEDNGVEDPHNAYFPHNAEYEEMMKDYEDKWESNPSEEIQGTSNVDNRAFDAIDQESSILPTLAPPNHPLLQLDSSCSRVEYDGDFEEDEVSGMHNNAIEMPISGEAVADTTQVSVAAVEPPTQGIALTEDNEEGDNYSDFQSLSPQEHIADQDVVEDASKKVESGEQLQAELSEYKDDYEDNEFERSLTIKGNQTEIIITQQPANEDDNEYYTLEDDENDNAQSNDGDYTPFPSVSILSPNQQEEDTNNNKNDEVNADAQGDLEEEDYEIDF